MYYKKAFTQYIVLFLVVLLIFSPCIASTATGSVFGSHAREGTPAEGSKNTPPEEPLGDIPAGPCGQAIAQKARGRIGEQAVNYFSQDPRHACAHFTSEVVNPIANPSPPLGNSAQGNYSSSAGQKIDKSELAPGDVVFFYGTYDNGRTVSHTGIYVGGNSFVDSGGSAGPGGTQTVRESSFNNYWNGHYYGAKRYCSGGETDE